MSDVWAPLTFFFDAKSVGVDFEKAKEIGINTIWALSLPGKVAPVTAAKFIKNTVYNILVELGV